MSTSLSLNKKAKNNSNSRIIPIIDMIPTIQKEKNQPRLSKVMLKIIAPKTPVMALNINWRSQKSISINNKKCVLK
jgi:hypothetical protein